MRKLYIVVALLFSAVSFAQSPAGMSYQATVRDSGGALLASQTVGMQISILAGSFEGTAVYTETQSPITNVNGLVSIEIGTGNTSDYFLGIDWSSGKYFIKTETDPTGGSNYSITGTTQLMSVPYALYAKTSGSSIAGPAGPQGAVGNDGATGADAVNQMTAAGDLIYGGTSGTVTVLAAGTAGQVLTVNIDGTALEWVEARDIIDVDAPAVAIASSALTNDSTPTISGTTEADATIEVSINGVALTGVVIVGTSWSVTATNPLADGDHVVLATATDASGNSSNVEQILEIDTPPPTVSIYGGAAMSVAVSDPSISGTTSVVAPASVTVAIDGVTQADQPVPNGVGAWELTLDGLLANGDRPVVASVTDGAGNIGTFTQWLTVGAMPPTLFIDGDAVAVTADQTPTVSGTSNVAAGQIVEFTLTRTYPPLELTRTAVVQANETWNMTPNGLTGGEWTILAAVNDPAGNTATATLVLTIDPLYAITSSALTIDSTPVITGTVESGSTIAVEIDGLGFTVSQDDAPNDTFWSATTTYEFANGSHPVLVTATNGEGERVLGQTLLIDLVVPSIAINGGVTNSTDDASAPIVGSTTAAAAAGIHVNVVIDGASPLTAVVQPNGSWTVKPTVDLAPEAHTIVATVADPAGNIGSFTQTLTVNGAVFVEVAPVPLGLTETFGAMTPDAAFTSTGLTTFRGDTGSTTYSFVGDAHDGESFIAPAYAAAYADLEAAYSNAAGRPVGTTMKGNISGEMFGPGVHTSVGAVSTTAELGFKIDAQGHSDAVFIFQVNAALALGANTDMVLVNGAQAKNVFWQVNGDGGIGAGNTFVGTLIANGAITSGEGAVINGRLLTKTGAIAMANNNLFSGSPSVSITGGTAIYSTVSAPSISGVTSVVAPALVTVTIDGVKQASQPVPDGGAWDLILDGPLGDGEYTIVASVIDGGGNVGSFTQILTVDTVDPIVTIAPGATDWTNNVTPTITGTTDVAGQTVTITFSRSAPTLNFTRTAISQADKIWNFTSSLIAGEWSIVANVVDPAGNTGDFTQVLSVASVAITSSDLTNDSTPTITGTNDAGLTIGVSIDDVAFTGVVVDGTTWSATATNALDHGNHNVSVTATNLAGNIATVTQVLTVDLIDPSVAIDPGETNSTNNLAPTITGKSDVAPGVIVDVTLTGPESTLTAAPVVQAGQTWEITPTLTAGDWTIVANVADPAGNTATSTQVLTVDTAGPVVAITSSDLTNNSTPTITGTAEAGATIEATIDGVVHTGVVDGTGWSVTSTNPLVDGDYPVSVTATDAAGNTATATQTLTIDTTLPLVAITSSALTNDSTPTISGMTEVGAQIAVSIDGVGLIVVVDGSVWTATATNPFPDGDYVVLATATDPVGNTATASQTLTIDTAPPAVAITSSAETNNRQPTIEGTTESGATITVSIDDSFITVTQVGTTWSATPADGELADLTHGTHQVEVVATGINGLTATDNQILFVDLSPPDVLIDDNDDDDPNDAAATTSDVTPAITGVTNAGTGQIVTVTFDLSGTTSVVIRTAVVQGDGTWNVIPILSEGVWSIEAAASDEVGNTGSFTQVLTVDLTAPALTVTSSVLADDETPTITGTTEAGAAISVSINGLPVFVTVTVDGTGWSATPTVGLADGEHNVSVTATDAVGNTATVTQTLTVDTTPPVLTVVHVGVTNDPRPEITGTTEAGATIAVDIEGNGAVFDVVFNGTAWSATPTGNLEEDGHQFTVTSTDPAGNSRTLTRTLTIDQTPPEVTLDGGSQHTTTDATPIISGSAVGVEVGSKVTVELAGDSGSPIPEMITEIGVGGVFEVTAATIANGNYTVTVIVTDDAGNTGDANQSLTVYAVAPAVTYTEGAVASTNDSTPLMSGTTNAVVGSAVTVTIGSQSLDTTVQSDATWNVTATILEIADYDVVVQVTDSDGNVGEATQTLSIVPTTITFTSGSAVTTGNPEISGTTDAAEGRKITVAFAHATYILTVAGGEWGFTAGDLGDGFHLATATVSTNDGTAGTATQMLTVDTTAPVVTIVDVGVTNDRTPEITLRTEAGATVTAVIVGVVVGVTRDSTDSTAWSATPMNDLGDGVYTITVTAADVLGNVATDSMSFRVDRTPPSVTIVGGLTDSTNDVTPTIVGGAVGAAGETVVVTLALPGTTDDVIRTALVQDDGTWNVTPSLSAGDWTILAEVTDAAGNIGSSTQALTVDLDAPALEITSSDLTNDSTPTISGTTEADATIEVTIDGVGLAGVVVDGSVWTATATNPLADGDYAVLATATDAVGNTATDAQTLTVDTTAQ
jgi:membrane protein implicated in regulation of membrane protease activity